MVEVDACQEYCLLVWSFQILPMTSSYYYNLLFKIELYYIFQIILCIFFEKLVSRRVFFVKHCKNVGTSIIPKHFMKMEYMFSFQCCLGLSSSY